MAEPIKIDLMRAPDFDTEYTDFAPEQNVYVQVSLETMEDKEGRPLSSLALSYLGDIARRNLPKDHVAQHTYLEEALRDMGDARRGIVNIVGPSRGEFYLEIPKHTSQAA